MFWMLVLKLKIYINKASTSSNVLLKTQESVETIEFRKEAQMQGKSFANEGSDLLRPTQCLYLNIVCKNDPTISCTSGRL